MMRTGGYRAGSGLRRWRGEVRLVPLFAAFILLIGCGERGSALIPATVGSNLSAPTATAPAPTATVVPTATSAPSAPAATPAPTPGATATASHPHASAMPTPPVASPSATGSPPTSDASALVVEVRIINFAFDPPVVVVPVGATVVWVNIEGYHTVLGADFQINSPILENLGDRYSYTFTEAGIYDYICGIHPDMLGVVQVVP